MRGRASLRANVAIGEVHPWIHKKPCLLQCLFKGGDMPGWTSYQVDETSWPTVVHIFLFVFGPCNGVSYSTGCGPMYRNNHLLSCCFHGSKRDLDDSQCSWHRGCDYETVTPWFLQLFLFWFISGFAFWLDLRQLFWTWNLGIFSFLAQVDPDSQNLANNLPLTHPIQATFFLHAIYSFFIKRNIHCL